MRFTKSIKDCFRGYEPWEYIQFSSSLSDKQLKEIRIADIDKSNHIFDGSRSGNKNKDKNNKNHQFREYITKENVSKYPALYELIEELRTKETRQTISSALKDINDYSNSYVRLEILNDVDGFWLEPHCDLKEKLISCLIYCNFENEDSSLGTDLYDVNLNLIKTLPYIHNSGYMFNGPNKWHGFEKNKRIKKERRGLQINYVTFKTDWKV